MSGWGDYDDIAAGSIDLGDLVRKCRRALHDFPDRAWLADDLIEEDGPSTIELSDGTAHFRTAGVRIEFDDRTDEMCLTTAPADTDAGTVVARRGMDGTAAVLHPGGTSVLIEPRFNYAQIADALGIIIGDEFWPYVWLPTETTLTPDFSTDAYDAPADVEELVFAYQRSAGYTYLISARFLSSALAGDVEFPNGATIIDPSSFYDSSDVFISWRKLATLTSVPSSQLEHLAILGACSHLMLMEESTHLAPAPSQVDRGVAEGAKLRAGAVQWQRFEAARQRKMISLTHEEQARRRTYLRGA